MPSDVKPLFALEEVQALKKEFDQLLRADLGETIQRMRDPETGKVMLNSDDLFRTLPRYEGHPEERMVLGPLLYPIARVFTDEIYAHLLTNSFGENDTVVFMAGGSATGKSTILRAAAKDLGVDFIVDTTFSNSERGLEQLDLALASGRKVELHYVYREFREAVIGMIERALDPKSGRIVPIDDMARTHFGAQRAVLGAMRKYGFVPDVSIRMSANSMGKLRPLSEQRFWELLHRSVDVLAELGQAVLDELRHKYGQRRSDGSDHDARRGNLYFSEAFYEAARSKTQSGIEDPGEVDEGRLRARGKKGEKARGASAQDHSG